MVRQIAERIPVAFRLRLGVGKDLRGLAVRALDAVLFDGGYQILNLKLHKIRLSVFM